MPLQQLVPLSHGELPQSAAEDLVRTANGIARATAERLLADGARVVATDTSAERLETGGGAIVHVASEAGLCGPSILSPLSEDAANVNRAVLASDGGWPAV